MNVDIRATMKSGKRINKFNWSYYRKWQNKDKRYNWNSYFHSLLRTAIFQTAFSLLKAIAKNDTIVTTKMSSEKCHFCHLKNKNVTFWKRAKYAFEWTTRLNAMIFIAFLLMQCFQYLIFASENSNAFHCNSLMA